MNCLFKRKMTAGHTSSPVPFYLSVSNTISILPITGSCCRHFFETTLKVNKGKTIFKKRSYWCEKWPCFPPLNRVTFANCAKIQFSYSHFKTAFNFGISCMVPDLTQERIIGFKSCEFLQNKISLRWFHSEKYPIMDLMEILFPTRSLYGHSFSTLEYIFNIENKYTQLKLRRQWDRILNCIQNLSVCF